MKNLMLFFALAAIPSMAQAKLTEVDSSRFAKAIGDVERASVSSQSSEQAGLFGYDRYHCKAFCVTVERYDISSMFSQLHATYMTSKITYHDSGASKSETFSNLVAACGKRRGVLLSEYTYSLTGQGFLSAKRADEKNACAGYDVSENSGASEVAASDFAICVEGKLRAAGVDPRMQNRWNPNLIAGKIQIQAIGLCEKEMKVGENRPKRNTPQALPARSNESLGGGSAIREI